MQSWEKEYESFDMVDETCPPGEDVEEERRGRASVLALRHAPAKQRSGSWH
jgi:hypothetical protein